MKKHKKTIVLIAAVVLLCVLGGLFLGRGKGTSPNTVFKTEEIQRGKLLSIVSATGTVEPEELVNVGAQIGGMIAVFGKDANGKPVDYGSPVKAGMVLARIDDSLYEAEERSSSAEKELSKAKLESAKASIAVGEARVMLAERNWTRAKKLSPSGAMARNDSDSAESEYLSAKANLLVLNAAYRQAQAQVISSTAAHDKAKRNLGYCTISSPVDGVIIDRRVSIGQTVNASMSAPSLFLIAKDLRKMQVWVSVNEADIGSLKPGMKAIFTVDSFPGERFKGIVSKIRLNATMSQNVVTYVVEVATDNSSGRLLPYLTANVKFIKDARENVLSVSNGAFRFTPANARTPEIPEGKRLVWKQEGKTAVPVPVSTGMNNGSRTEITGGELKEGDEVITGTTTVAKAAQAANANNSSPFLPKPPMHGRTKKK